MNFKRTIGLRICLTLGLLVFLGMPLGQAQTAKEIAKAREDIAELQSKLRQSNDRSNQGAKLLLKLTDLADQYGRPFTLIQAGKRFVVSNPDHRTRKKRITTDR